MKKHIVLCIAALLSSAGISVADYPRRIVSLAPSITKNLSLLGVSDRVIGITTYCPAPQKGQAIIGTVLEPNIEKIVSLTPDLVIATREGNVPHTVGRLRSMGVRVMVMDAVNNFDEVCAGFLMLGKAVGREETANAIIMRSRQRIRAISEKLRGRKPRTVFWEVGAQPLFTVSRNTFVNDFIERAGGTNIFADVKTRYPQISREEVISRNPEFIIMVTMGDVTTREKEYWQQFGSLRAAKNGTIFILSDSSFTDPTPVAIAEGIEKIATLLHGIR